MCPPSCLHSPWWAHWPPAPLTRLRPSTPTSRPRPPALAPTPPWPPVHTGLPLTRFPGARLLRPRRGAQSWRLRAPGGCGRPGTRAWLPEQGLPGVRWVVCARARRGLLGHLLVDVPGGHPDPQHGGQRGVVQEDAHLQGRGWSAAALEPVRSPGSDPPAPPASSGQPPATGRRAHGVPRHREARGHPAWLCCPAGSRGLAHTDPSARSPGGFA